MLGICAGLSWFIVQELQAPPPEPLPVAGGQAPVLPDLPAEPSFAMVPAETFSDIVERPLFSPTRRPPAEGTVTIQSPEPELDITLVGIIISAEEEIAIIKPKDGSQFLRLSEGDNFRGWTLDSIEPDRLTFRRGEVEEHIELTYDEPPPVKKPRRRKRKTRDTRSKNQTQGQTPDKSRTQEQND
jgi:general secretion pathway protein N